MPNGQQYSFDDDSQENILFLYVWTPDFLHPKLIGKLEWQHITKPDESRDISIRLCDDFVRREPL